MAKKLPMKKGKVKGPVGGPAGVTVMSEGGAAESAAPRPTKTTRTGTKGYKAKTQK